MVSSEEHLFSEKGFVVSMSDIRHGLEEDYLFLKCDSKLALDIKDWVLAANTAAYIQEDSAYAGRFMDKEAYDIACIAREKMAEFNFTEGEAIDEAVAEYTKNKDLRKD